VGAWNDDRLVVLGRIDDIVQVRGYNVALGAVETAITESGLAREAVIMATEDPVDGHRLIGLAIPARDLGSDADAVDMAAWVQDIAQAVRERLGSAAVPATLTPVSVLPYLSNGKIDRLAVHRALISRDGGTGQDETEGMR
jgi:acyl-coenzyme A synthetase/AMP-(fatty) acid ligase